jgi:threonyl-tRNA synthetase
MWDLAEKRLSEALDSFTTKIGSKWEVNPGDGAFYGPKIDITLTDALRRDHQCGTIQLDFNLPRRFKLRYVASKDETISESDKADPELPDGYARPVMIHRAVLGSVERMFGVLTEHFAGKWPFWLSPRQILVVPVMPSVNDYAKEVQKIFYEKGLFIDVDTSSNTFQKKIRTGQLEQYNFIFGKSRNQFTPSTVVDARLTPKLQSSVTKKPSRALSTFATATTRPPRPKEI